MKTKHLAIVIALLSILGASSSSLIPDGWRVPTLKETAYSIPIREKDPNRYLFTEDDFNGDGKVDVAKILVNDKGNKLALFVFLASEASYETILLTEIDDKTLARRMGVSKLGPGEQKTACGKGYWECKEGNSPLLIVNRPAIKFFQFESASSFFVWDELSKSFKRVWISD